MTLKNFSTKKIMKVVINSLSQINNKIGENYSENFIIKIIDNINKEFICFKYISKIYSHYSPSIKNNDEL